MSAEFPVPQRGTTYQSRVKPWVSDADDPCGSEGTQHIVGWRMRALLNEFPKSV